MNKSKPILNLKPVEFSWSETCIDDEQFRLIVDGYLEDRNAYEMLVAGMDSIVGVVDTRGSRCPFPVRELRSASLSMLGGQQVVLLADDPVAVVDIPFAVMQDGNYLRVRYRAGSVSAFLVEKS